MDLSSDNFMQNMIIEDQIYAFTIQLKEKDLEII